MEPKYSACQSCGMPFRNDPMGGGTKTDGSRCTLYCSHCYLAGKFTQPDITVTQMQQLVKEKLQSMGWFHRLFAAYFAKSIPKLVRWQQPAAKR